MTARSESIVIDRPPDEVFAFLDDVSREREWQPNLRSATQDPPGPTKVGTRKRYSSSFMGRDVQNTYEVVELDPGRRLVCQTTSDSAISARTELVCEAQGTGTRVTMWVDAKPKGFLKLIPRGVLETASVDELKATLARLKATLEAGA